MEQSNKSFAVCVRTSSWRTNNACPAVNHQISPDLGGFLRTYCANVPTVRAQQTELKQFEGGGYLGGGWSRGEFSQEKGFMTVVNGIVCNVLTLCVSVCV